MLILGILCFGILVGVLAELIVNGSISQNWGRILAFGLGGSLVGGILASAIFGDGLDFRPSGIIGSIVGAVLLTAGAEIVRRRSA